MSGSKQSETKHVGKPDGADHAHVFLGAAHESNEKKTWSVIVLCVAMMVVEIVGGQWFGSLALVADGLHMSTHAGAMLITALAYTYARRHLHDPRFGFGTGKFGDLAGFTSAIVLVMIALLIGYEAVDRLITPVEIHFTEAIPIAAVGLAVNIVSAWLLAGDHHGHGHHGHIGHHEHHRDHQHEHGHDHDHDHAHMAPTWRFQTPESEICLQLLEREGGERFVLSCEGAALPATLPRLETVAADGVVTAYGWRSVDGVLESDTVVPEPHNFLIRLYCNEEVHIVRAVEPEQGDAHAHDGGHAHHGHAKHVHHDNNMRSAYLHVLADAAVSVLTIVGLLLAKWYGWVRIDPLVSLVGAGVIASWSWTLVRDTARVLLDVVPDPHLHTQIRHALEVQGDAVLDLHLWRVGPGHLSLLLLVESEAPREPDHYRAKLACFPMLSHVSIEVRARKPESAPGLPQD